MGGSTPLLDRLLELVKEVDVLKDTEQKSERDAVSKRVETELDEIEKKIEKGTTMGTQQLAMVGLVRSALQSDRGEGDFEWSDDSLQKAHGLVTYASQDYWDEAYAGKRYGESFDWYGAWDEPTLNQKGQPIGPSLGDTLRPHLHKEARILMLGCGNSNMSAIMYREGYENIVNVDISQPVIHHMKATYGSILGKMSWLVMDATKLEFGDGSFDAVIEKGMFDALFAGTGQKVEAVLTETRRVLRKGGVMITVTYSGDRISQLFEAKKESLKMEPVTDLKCAIAGQLRTKKDGGPRVPSDKTAKSEKGEFFAYACEKL